jgi:hypothetical protein
MGEDWAGFRLLFVAVHDSRWVQRRSVVRPRQDSR